MSNDGVTLKIPGSSLLHWFAAASACIILVAHGVMSNISFWWLVSRLAPGNQSNGNSMHGSKEVLRPYSERNPFAFVLIVYFGVSLAAFIISEAESWVFKRILQGADWSTVKQRLNGGRCKFSKILSYVMEQYDDGMIEGCLGAVENSFKKKGILGIGMALTIMTHILYHYIIQTRAYDPTVGLSSYVFVLLIPLLSAFILSESTNSIRLIISFLSFFGAFLCFKTNQSFNVMLLPTEPSELTDDSNWESWMSQMNTWMLCSLVSAQTAFSIIWYKRANPTGNVIKIIQYQTAIGAAICALLLLSFQFLADQIKGVQHLQSLVSSELFNLRLADISILFFSITSVFIYSLLINEALRWGGTATLGNSLILIPCLTKVFVNDFFHPMTRLSGDSPGALSGIQEAGASTGVGLSVTTFVLSLVIDFSIAVKKRKMRNSRLNEKHLYKVIDDFDNESLVTGDVYSVN